MYGPPPTHTPLPTFLYISSSHIAYSAAYIAFLVAYRHYTRPLRTALVLLLFICRPPTSSTSSRHPKLWLHRPPYIQYLCRRRRWISYLAIANAVRAEFITPASSRNVYEISSILILNPFLRLSLQKTVFPCLQHHKLTIGALYAITRRL